LVKNSLAAVLLALPDIFQQCRIFGSAVTFYQVMMDPEFFPPED
jgi:hypothetical protein